jgi:hypothetical protein
MTPEEYYKEVVKLDMDKFDKKAPKFDYYDLIDFADSYHKKQLTLTDVVSSKPDRKSLRQIIEERRTNLCLTASILKAGGKNETFFVGKYELLDNILNEFDGIDEPN